MHFKVRLKDLPGLIFLSNGQSLYSLPEEQARKRKKPFFLLETKMWICQLFLWVLLEHQKTILTTGIPIN